MINVKTDLKINVINNLLNNNYRNKIDIENIVDIFNTRCYENNNNDLILNEYHRFITLQMNSLTIGLKRSEVYPHLFLFTHDYDIKRATINIVEDYNLLSVLSNNMIFTGLFSYRNIDYKILDSSNLDLLCFNYATIICNDFNAVIDTDICIFKRKSRRFLQFIDGNYVNMPFQSMIEIKNSVYKNGYYYRYFSDEEFNDIVSEYEKDDNFNIIGYLE